MTYQQACADSGKLPHLTHSDLEGRRHFVGLWTLDCYIAAISESEGFDTLHPSRSEPYNSRTLSCSALSINGGKFLTVGATLNIGHKDISPPLKVVGSEDFRLQIDSASNVTVLFYSSLDRRSWLLDGASALVYLARAWISSKSTTRNLLVCQDDLPCVQDLISGTISAAAVLEANEHFKIFEVSETKHEAVRSTSSASEPASDSGYTSRLSKVSSTTKEETKTTTTTSPWTYKDLVVSLWRNLEAMKDKLDQLKVHGPEIKLRKPTISPVLVGWDTADFLSSRRPVHPRYVELGSESKCWTKLAKEITAIPLMAESFGDMILPSLGSPVCQNMRILPKDRDLLAAPLSVLRLTAQRFLRWQGENSLECVRVTDSTFMYGLDPLARDCRCSSGVPCKSISELGRRARRAPQDTASRLGHTLFETHPRAAVVLGSPISIVSGLRERLSRMRRLRQPDVGYELSPTQCAAELPGSEALFETQGPADLQSENMSLCTGYEELGEDINDGNDDDDVSVESAWFSCKESQTDSHSSLE